jgi:hypothetical protein
MAKRKRQQPSPFKPSRFDKFEQVYSRVEYRDAPIPSCDARRLLRESIDCLFVQQFIGTFDHFVGELDQHPKRDAILSEIIAIWFLAECGEELEARGKDLERRFNGTA